MHWIKHFNDSRKTVLVSDIIKKFGLLGYGQYWALLEMLNDRLEGDRATITIPTREVRDCLRFKSTKKLVCYLDTFNGQRGLKVKISEDEITFKAPILLELQSRDSKYTRTKRAKRASVATLEIEKEIEIEIEIDNKEKRGVDVSVSKKTKPPKPKANKPVFDFESLYQNHYPRKEGKKKGIETLHKSIKTQDEFNNFNQAIKNYVKKLVRDRTEKRYVKKFSTFANDWEDFIELEDDDCPIYSEDSKSMIADMQRWTTEANEIDYSEGGVE